LPHAAPVIVVLAATAGMVLVLAPDTELGRAVAILLAMLGAQLVIGVVNELVDLPLDREVKPSKPLAAGIVTVRGAWVMLACGFALMIGAGARLSVAALALCLLGCGVGVAYSVWFKRTILAWLPYLVALPLLPIYVAAATGTFSRDLLLLYPLGVFAVIGVQIAQSVPDVEADRTAKITSLTTRLGERGSMATCGLTMLASVALVAIAGSDRAWVGRVSVAVALGVVVVGAVYLFRPRSAVMAAFPVTAVGTALLGVTWVYASGT
jgi:geranylgeranylglycerol-phosphate geranylgeranyltransferase